MYGRVCQPNKPYHYQDRVYHRIQSNIPKGALQYSFLYTNPFSLVCTLLLTSPCCTHQHRIVGATARYKRIVGATWHSQHGLLLAANTIIFGFTRGKIKNPKNKMAAIWNDKKTSSTKSSTNIWWLELLPKPLPSHWSLPLKGQCHEILDFTCGYLCEFSKKFEMTLMLFSGAWGKWLMNNTWSKNSRDIAPCPLHIFSPL